MWDCNKLPSDLSWKCCSATHKICFGFSEQRPVTLKNFHFFHKNGKEFHITDSVNNICFSWTGTSLDIAKLWNFFLLVKSYKISLRTELNALHPSIWWASSIWLWNVKYSTLKSLKKFVWTLDLRILKIVAISIVCYHCFFIIQGLS